MAWMFSKAGTRSGVAEALEAAAKQTAEPQRIGALTQFVKGEIEAMPPKFNGVRVIVSQSDEAGRTFQIQVIPMSLEL